MIGTKRLFSDLVVIGICSLISVKARIVRTDSNGIFTIPMRIMDDVDILEEHGRFMLANMNPTIDPCENFYEYACGNWQNDTMVPVLRRNDTLLEAMQNQIQDMFLNFLKNKTVKDEKSAESKAKKFFDSCLNMVEDLSSGYRTINNSIKEPILKEGETLDWMLLNFYQENSPNPLLPLSIAYNSSSYTYDIILGNLNEQKALSDFNFTKIAEDFKLENRKAAQEEWEELKTFETKLFAIVTKTKSNLKYDSVKDFLKVHNSSEMNFERFFNLAFNGTTNESWKISYNIMNFTDISKFLRESDTGIMFKYVRWRIILLFYQTFGWDEDDEDLSNEKRCQFVTENFFKNALIPWFIETTFDKERRADALLISKHLKDTFYTLIDQTTWLDNETKSEAKSKLRAMGLYFGYTDDMRNRLEMDEKFKDVNITKNLWANLMNLGQNNERYILGKIGKASIEFELDIDLANAMYSPELNQAFMAIGVSQLPLYHIKLPNSLKFAGIGSIIGHEMVHGFDSGCYEYDYDGKKRNWWSSQSLLNFKERYQCLESQYNKFIYEGVRINGKKTSGDNIADNVGLKIAYQSYLQFLAENKDLESDKDKPLPGVDFTNKHLFFLKFAQNWCDGRNVDKRLENMPEDVHSMNEFRVIGSLMNLPEFSEVFNCALGTNMNPLKKCIIYGNE